MGSIVNEVSIQKTVMEPCGIYDWDVPSDDDYNSDEHCDDYDDYGDMNYGSRKYYDTGPKCLPYASTLNTKYGYILDKTNVKKVSFKRVNIQLF